MEVLQQHVNTPPPRLPASLSRYSSLVAQLLSKRRENRFGTAEEVIAASVSLGNGRRRTPSAA